MNLGMMWYDGDQKKPLERKVAEAAAYFQKKYGEIPNACIVNPVDMPAGLTELVLTIQTSHPLITRGVTIGLTAMRAILPGNFWIGCEEQS